MEKSQSPATIPTRGPKKGKTAQNDIHTTHTCGGSNALCGLHTEKVKEGAVRKHLFAFNRPIRDKAQWAFVVCVVSWKIKFETRPEHIAQYTHTKRYKHHHTHNTCPPVPHCTAFDPYPRLAPRTEMINSNTLLSASWPHFNLLFARLSLSHSLSLSPEIRAERREDCEFTQPTYIYIYIRTRRQRCECCVGFARRTRANKKRVHLAL